MNITRSGETEQSARLSCRVNPLIKRRAEEAAALLGQSMTDFTEAALKEKSELVLEQASKIRLSERDFKLFTSAINASKTPTAKLVAAMQKYDRQSAEEPKGNW